MGKVIQGLRVVTESVQDGPIASSSSRVTLYAGDRSRPGLDSPGASYDIQRRDLRKTFRVFVQQRRYQEIPIAELLSPQELAAFTRSGRHWSKRHAVSERPPSGNFRISIDYEKTQDEAVIFDCLARRWRISRLDEQTQGIHTNSTETVSEAWYLDSDQAMNLYPGFSPKLMKQGFCFVTVNGEKPVIERRGEAPEGLCIRSETKTITHLELPSGEIREQQYLQSSRVLELAEESFADSIFEPPSGFRKMPVYPSRITMARLDAARSLKYFGARLQSSIFRRTGP